VKRTFLFVAFAIGALGARAQGGPPMITDDPGTPGNGKFEINLAGAFERRPQELSMDLPAIDEPKGERDLRNFAQNGAIG